MKKRNTKDGLGYRKPCLKPAAAAKTNTQEPRHLLSRARHLVVAWGLSQGLAALKSYRC